LQKKAWEISENTKGDKEKIQALSLAKECVINKLDLLTNATVVDDAIRFTKQSQGKIIIMSKEEKQDDNESKEPDYHDEDKEQLEGEQEKETEETTNKFFKQPNSINAQTLAQIFFLILLQ
jgi:G3E family GTPase